MRTSLVLTVIGTDRPGIVEQLSDRLAADLQAVASGDLTVVIERSGEIEVSRFLAISLEIVGQDRPGIVRDISHVLARRGVNIEELETEVSSAAMSGESIFRARARLRLPDATNVDDIRNVLEAMADNLMVDIVFDERESITRGVEA
jgi:glycine cleavage system regulatory protein